MSLVVSFDELFSNEVGLLAKASHWERTELRDVATVINGYALKSSLFNKDKGIPIVRIRDLKFNRTETFTTEKVPSQYTINDGDYLIGMDGDFICYEWTGGQAILNQRVCKLVPNERYLHPKFCFYAINGYLEAIQEVTSSVTVKHLSSIDLLKIPFPIPPLAEQHRIVSRLDELMEKIDRSRTRLEKIPQVLKRFRQSILAAAVNGQLTASRSEWKDTHLANLVGKGDIFDGPFGSNLKTSDYTSGGVRVIRLENIEHLRFVDNKETYISKQKYQTLLRHTVGEGDIIFSSFIAEEIRACILPKLQCKAIAKADCFCIRPNGKLVNKHFLLLSLASSKSYSQLVHNIHGATRPRINTTQLKDLKLSIPDLDDQQRIVDKVEQLFSLADQIQDRYNSAKRYVDTLPQSLLAMAFRGDLVSQVTSDEPAEFLVQRIAQRKVSAPQKASKKQILEEYETVGTLSLAAEHVTSYKGKKAKN